jgi:hypothetical protein
MPRATRLLDATASGDRKAVLLAVAEWRQAHRHHVQPVLQVLPELPAPIRAFGSRFVAATTRTSAVTTCSSCRYGFRT